MPKFLPTTTICIIVVFLFFFSARPVSAASIVLSSSQPTLSPEEDYLVNVSLNISVSDNTSYYLRGAFYKEEGSYCGYTWNGNSWYNGPYTTSEGWKNLSKVTIQGASWSGQLKFRLDIEDSGCSSSGKYYFKVQRYTEGGSSNFDTQEALTFDATIPTPTPTSTPTPTPSPTPTSTPIPTKTPTPTPTKTSTPKPTKSDSGGGTISENSDTEVDVLGLRNRLASEEPSPLPDTETSKKKSSVLPVLFIIFGAGLMGFAGYTLFKKMKTEGYNNQDGENI